MAKSKAQIQKESDARRGVKDKKFQLPLTTIDKIKQLSDERGISQSQLIVQLIDELNTSK
ncbi:MAG: ribbon-helix-helix protein, CopG family [Gammaproteobacteria bacterium]|nr:ribbon-helix-helix protein, CopG family [Gammaproteobacteria bacterium]